MTAEEQLHRIAKIFGYTDALESIDPSGNGRWYAFDSSKNYPIRKIVQIEDLILGAIGKKNP